MLSIAPNRLLSRVRLVWNFSFAFTLMATVAFAATTSPAQPVYLGSSSALVAAPISSTRIDLSWQDRSYGEQAFVLERKEGTGANGVFSPVATIPANTVLYRDLGVKPRTAYSYRVRAVAGTQSGPLSNVAMATTTAAPPVVSLPPSPPTGLAITAASAAQISLSWKDNSTNETKFRIERKSSAAAAYSEIAQVGTNVSVYIDTGLTGGTLYVYRVRAMNNEGNSAYSNEVYTITPIPLPSAISDLTALGVSASQINLTWTDTSAYEWGYRIERKTDLNGSYAEIKLTAANVTTYQDTGLAPDTWYYYRVRAVNSVGDSSNSNVATATTLRTQSISALSAGTKHVVALRNDGTVWTLGYNNYGQLGDGTTLNRSTPYQLTSLAGVSEIAAGEHHSVAAKQDGTVWTWGSNVYGQLGDGTTIAHAVPAKVPGLTSIVSVAAAVTTGGYDDGESHTAALRSDGTVWCWGENRSGALGDGTTTMRTSPVQVKGLGDVVLIAAGGYHNLALKNDGTVWAWGNNSYYGQCGDGTTINRLTPVAVAGLTNVVAISAGTYHSVALKLDGTVWTWGFNAYGILGNGTAGVLGNSASYVQVSSTVPVQVPGLTGIVEVAAGSSYVLARKNDGSVWAWGRNVGTLGDGTLTQRNSPVQIKAATGIVHLAAGGWQSLFMKPDGTVLTCGWNSKGEMGKPTSTTYQLTPMLLNGLDIIQ